MNENNITLPIWSSLKIWQKMTFSLTVIYAGIALFLFESFHTASGDARKIIDIIMAPLYLCISGILYLCKDTNGAWAFIYSLLQNKFLYTTICFICFGLLSGILFYITAKVIQLIKKTP